MMFHNNYFFILKQYCFIDKIVFSDKIYKYYETFELGKSQKERKMMDKKEKIANAILSVFPNSKSLMDFAEYGNNEKTVQSFIDLAAREKIIEVGNLKSLKAFIRNNGRQPEECEPPLQLTFDEFLKKRARLLKINFSVRAWVDRVNAMIEDNRLDLPQVTNPMLTRLKTIPADTNYKQNVLRGLAFWIGYERANLGPAWNFETLLKICPDKISRDRHKEGVRIGFALCSRGDVIDHIIMNWLKKTIRNCLEQTMGGPLSEPWGNVRSHDFTTIYVDMPKEDGGSDPTAYRTCLRNAMTLAHQISTRWALSKHCTRNRFLSIGIVTGKYSSLDNSLLSILNAKLSNDPVIRVSDYVRQCLLINDIRVMLCQQPSEITLISGEVLSIWWIEAFWSWHYFDFVPDLLDDRILKNEPSAEETLSQLLWFPDESDYKSDEDGQPNAITAFFKFPHNSLLGVEIAKTLYYRKRFPEAIEILRRVLSVDPTNLTARTLCMALYRELALEASFYPEAENLLKQAVNEALYINEYRDIKSEDFYIEYAEIYMVKAILMLRCLRGGGITDIGMMSFEHSKQSLFKAINRAEFLLEKAMTASPTSIRSGYLLNVARILKVILQDDEILTNPQKPIDGQTEMIKRVTVGPQWQLSFMKKGLSREHQQNFLERISIQRFQKVSESISLRVYQQSNYFGHAVALWDFLPVRTIATAKRVLEMLDKAIAVATIAAKDDLCVYSNTRIHFEIMPADEYIRYMENAIRMIKDKAGEDLATRSDSEIIKRDDNAPHLLMTLNL